MGADPLAELNTEEKRILAELAQAKAEGRMSKRDLLRMGGALGVGAAMGGGGYLAATESAQAATNQAGTVGTSGSPVDVEGEDLNVTSINTDEEDTGRQNRTHYASYEAESAGAATNTEIQTVIDASSPGDTVVIDGLEDASGVSEPYSLGSAVSIPSDREIVVDAHVQASASANGFVNADQTNGNNNITVRGTAGGHLDGNASTGARGIEFNKGDNYSVRNLRVSGWASDGILLWSVTESEAVNNHLSGGATTGTAGSDDIAHIRVGISGGSTDDDIVVSGNRSVDSNHAGIIARQCLGVSITGNVVLRPFRNGVHLESTTTEYTVSENVVRDGGDSTTVHGQIYVASLCDHGSVTGNTCANKTNGHGIHVEQETHDVSVTGNTCVENDLKGIFSNIGGSANAPTGNSFTGNTCVENGHDGIRLVGVEHSTLSGNTCRDNNQSAASYDGIHLTDCLDCSVGNNSCTLNTYGIRASGTTDYCAYAGNTTRGNATGGLSTNGANSLTAANV